MNEPTLKELRKKIDAIDDSILELLRKRISVAKEIGKAKKNSLIYDPEREKMVIQRLLLLAPDIESEALSNIYTSIITLCRSVQMRSK